MAFALSTMRECEIDDTRSFFFFLHFFERQKYDRKRKKVPGECCKEYSLTEKNRQKQEHDEDRVVFIEKNGGVGREALQKKVFGRYLEVFGRYRSGAN